MQLRRPCATCPFRSDRFFHLAKGRKQEIADSLRSTAPGGGGTFQCHNTLDYDEDDQPVNVMGSEKAAFCAGALIVMEKEGVLIQNQAVRIMNRLGMLDLDAIDVTSKTYDTLDDWIAACE